MSIPVARLNADKTAVLCGRPNCGQHFAAARWEVGWYVDAKPHTTLPLRLSIPRAWHQGDDGIWRLSSHAKTRLHQGKSVQDRVKRSKTTGPEGSEVRIREEHVTVAPPQRFKCPACLLEQAVEPATVPGDANAPRLYVIGKK